mmetsp:Transcript_100054/g.278736  ORF Transcript_100054/g.278736 Transcript_100054/m.278736 type:complete len:80 (-) Transcript_100054:154-393(-)
MGVPVPLSAADAALPLGPVQHGEKAFCMDGVLYTVRGGTHWRPLHLWQSCDVMCHGSALASGGCVSSAEGGRCKLSENL